MLYRAITDIKNRQQYTTRLRVYVVRQNGTRKSNLDVFVAVQERSSGVTSPFVNLVACTSSFVNEIQNIPLYTPIKAAIGPSSAQTRAATSKNPTTCTLPSDVISHNLIHHRYINVKDRRPDGRLTVATPRDAHRAVKTQSYQHFTFQSSIFIILRQDLILVPFAALIAPFEIGFYRQLLRLPIPSDHKPFFSR